MTISKCAMGLGALAAGFLATGALACDNEKTIAATEGVPSVTVSYSDLNLATGAGVKALQRRIIAAAKQVCASPDPRNLSAVVASRACQAQAIARAHDDVQLPVMAAAAMRMK